MDVWRQAICNEMLVFEQNRLMFPPLLNILEIGTTRLRRKQMWFCGEFVIGIGIRARL